MGGLARSVLILAGAAHVSSLHVPQDPAARRGEALPGDAESPSWMEEVLEDMLADDVAFGPDTAMLRTQDYVLNGYERARAFNNCPVKYRAPSFPPMPLVSAQRRLVYFLEGKSGSSTLRGTLNPSGPASGVPGSAKRKAWDPYDKKSANFTHFTFVRDPVSRMISAWFESGLVCSGGQGKDILLEDPASNASRARVLGWFEEYVEQMERRDAHSCWGPHEGGQRGRLPSLKKGVGIEFVGVLSQIHADWKELAARQKEKFGVEIGELHAAARVAHTNKTLLLNASVLPRRVISRICSIYRDDYCCFRLPIPATCHIDCYYAERE